MEAEKQVAPKIHKRRAPKKRKRRRAFFMEKRRAESTLAALSTLRVFLYFRYIGFLSRFDILAIAK